MGKKCNTGGRQELIKIYGEETTHVLIDMDNNNIPTIEDAAELYKQFKIKPKDEQVNLYGKKVKTEQINTQISTLRDIFVKGQKIADGSSNDGTVVRKLNTKKQNETLKKLLESSEKQLLELEADEKTTSVSKFILASEFKGDQSLYENYRLFGSFIHDTLEQLQVTAFDKGTPITETFNRKYFDDIYEKYDNKLNVDPDIIFKQLARMVNTFGSYVNDDAILLPEITIKGKTKESIGLLGRVDLLVLNSDGTVDIIDFKTKRMIGVFGDKGQKNNIIYSSLAYESFPVAISQSGEKFGSAYKETGNRTAYDTWMLQLDAYGNILEQSGVEVRNKKISALVYDVVEEKEEYLFNNATIIEFDNHDYYEKSLVRIADADGKVIKDKTYSTKKIENYQRITDIEIPVEGKEIKESANKTIKSDIYDFAPTEKNMDFLVKKLNVYLAGQLETLRKELDVLRENEEANEADIEILENRKKSLLELKRFAEREDISSTEKTRNINFFTALDIVYEDLNSLAEITVGNLKEYNKIKDVTTKRKLGETIRVSYHKAESLGLLIDPMREIVNEADTPIDSPIRKKLSYIETNLDKIQAAAAEVNMKSSIEVLRAPGEKTYTSLSKDQAEYLTLEIIKEKKKLAKLKDGSKIGIISGIKDTLYMYMGKKLKSDLFKELDENESKEARAIIETEKKIATYELAIEGVSFSEEAITRYIDGVVNPESNIFIGSDSVFNNDGILSSFKADEYIASADNSEIGIAAPVLFMKNAMNEATKRIMSDKKVLNFDRQKTELLKHNTLEELNEMTSNWDMEVYYDSKTNTKKERRVLNFATPYSLEYANKFRSFGIDLRILNKEKEDAEILFNENFRNEKLTEEEIQELKDDVLRLKKEINLKKDEQLDWKIENSSLPYTADFYKIQRLMPTEIRDEIQELYFEKEIIIESFNGSLMMFTDKEFEELQEIDIEINKLKIKAEEINPEYGKYMEMFEDLYEFNTNDDYFDRVNEDAKSKYGGENTDEYKKWLSRNTTYKPTSDWYSMRQTLLDRRSDLFKLITKDSATKDELDLLRKKKSKIMAEFKINGEFHSKFMSTEKVIEYSTIEDEITILQDKVNKENAGDIDENIKAELKKITRDLNEIQTKAVSPLYQKEFDDRVLQIKELYEELGNTREKYREGNETKEFVIRLEEQFLIDEAEFKVWYEKNHTNEYISITKEEYSPSNKTIRSFNEITIPSPSVRDKYMRITPISNKYYSVKTLRRENWYLSGKHLHSTEIAELKKNDKFNQEELVANGALIIKEGAYNKDYIKTPGNILMPKDITSNGDNTFKINNLSANVNKKFFDLTKNNDMYSFYNNLTSMYFDLQEKVQGRKTGYMVPGATATMVERIAKGESITQAMKDQIQVFNDKVFKTDGSQDDLIENTFGDTSLLRMKYTQQYEEGYQSEDAISALMKYTVEANSNIALQEVAPQVDGYIDLLKMKYDELEKMSKGGKSQIKDNDGNLVTIDVEKRKKDLKKIIDITEFEKKKFLYGQSDTITNRKVKKWLNAMFSYTSFIRIGFSVTNQIKNNVAGNLQAIIATGSGHMSMTDYLYAKRKLYALNDGILSNYFADYGRIADISKTTMLYRLFDTKQEGIEKVFGGIAGTKWRKVLTKMVDVQEVAYLLQDKGESEINATTMFAILNHYKYKVIKSVNEKTGEITYDLDENGEPKMIPAHEIYMKGSNGELTRRNDVDFTDEDEKYLHHVIYSEIRRAQGNYAKSDMTKAEATVMGKVLFYFRKFLLPMMLNRFGYARESWETGNVGMGYWRGTTKAIKHFGLSNVLQQMILGDKAKGMEYSYVADGVEYKGDMFKNKITQTRNDIAVMTLLTMLAMFAVSFKRQKDDDDEELSVMEGNLLRILMGVKGEAVSMFPVGGGSDEYIRNFTTAIPFVREITKANKSISHATNYVEAMLMGGGEEPDMNYDSEYYENTWKKAFYTKKSGTFEKGDSKLMKDVVDLTGVKNIRDIFSPNHVVDELLKRQ